MASKVTGVTQQVQRALERSGVASGRSSFQSDSLSEESSAELLSHRTLPETGKLPIRSGSLLRRGLPSWIRAALVAGAIDSNMAPSAEPAQVGANLSSLLADRAESTLHLSAKELASFNGAIYSLAVCGEDSLVVGTHATSVAGSDNSTSGSSVFLYKDGRWSPVGSGIEDGEGGPGYVATLTVNDGSLFAGGYIDYKGEAGVGVLSYNSNRGYWQSLDDGKPGTIIESIAFGKDGTVFVAGERKIAFGLYHVVLSSYQILPDRSTVAHELWGATFQVGAIRSISIVPLNLITGEAADSDKSCLVGSGDIHKYTEPGRILRGQFYAPIDANGHDLSITRFPKDSPYELFLHGVAKHQEVYGGKLCFLGDPFAMDRPDNTQEHLGPAVYWEPVSREFLAIGSLPLDGEITCAKSYTLPNGKELLLVGGDLTLDGTITKFAVFDGLSWRAMEISNFDKDLIPTTLAVRTDELLNVYMVAGFSDGSLLDLPIFTASTSDPRAELRAYPNPTTGAVSILGSSGARGEIFDVTGRRIAEMVSAPLPLGGGLLQWDGLDKVGAKAPSGTYFIRVIDAEGAVSRSTSIRLIR